MATVKKNEDFLVSRWHQKMKVLANLLKTSGFTTCLKYIAPGESYCLRLNLDVTNALCVIRNVIWKEEIN